MLNFQQKEISLEKYFDVLKKCQLFDNIADGDLFGMLTCLRAKVVSFDKKYTIFAEGSPAKYLGIVLSGSVQMYQIDYYGNRSILAEIGPSEVFAEAFACAELTSMPVSVVSNEPTEVMLVDCEHILHTCAGHCSYHQQLIFNLMKNLATKTLNFHQKIEITSKRTTRDKLLTYLMFQSKKFDSDSFNIPFDRQELADFLEVDRSGLSAEISKLKKEGIIDSRKNYFELL